jgi:hypothetical protein
MTQLLKDTFINPITLTRLPELVLKQAPFYPGRRAGQGSQGAPVPFRGASLMLKGNLMSTKKQQQKEDNGLVLGLGLVSGLVSVLVSVSVLVLVLVSGSLSVLDGKRFTDAYILGYFIGIALGVFLLATGIVQVPHSIYNATTTLTTTTIQPFNLTCQQIRSVVNGNITTSQQTAQTYLQLYRAKGCTP